MTNRARINNARINARTGGFPKLTIADTFSLSQTIETVVGLVSFSSTFSVSDSQSEIIVQQLNTVADVFALSDILARREIETLADTFSVTGDPFWPPAVISFPNPMVWAQADSIDLSDDIDLLLRHYIADSLAFSGVLTRTLIQHQYELSDTVDFAESYVSVLTKLVTDAFSASDSMAVSGIVGVLKDFFRIQDEVFSLITRQFSLSDVYAVLDTVSLQPRWELSDVLTIVDQVEDKIRKTLTLLDTILVSDSFSYSLSLLLSIKDNFNVKDTFFETIQTKLEISDSLEMVGTFRIAGEGYLVWAFNPKTLGPYRLVFPKNISAFERIGGQNVICAEDGIYVTGGDTDDGEVIKSFIKTGFERFDDPERHFDGSKMKQLLNGYLVLTTEGDTLLKIITTRRGEAVQTWFKCTEKPTAMSKVQLRLSTALRSVLYQFEISPLTDDPAKYRMLEIIPLFLNRSI